MKSTPPSLVNPASPTTACTARLRGIASAVLLALCVGLFSPTHAAAAPPQSPPPKSEIPTGAIILEATGAVVAGAGVIVFAVGMTQIGLRNQLACVDQEDSGFEVFGTSFGGCTKGSAVEAKELEDSGILLTTVGAIIMGVGAAALIVGTIWLLVHKPKHQPIKTTLLPSSPPSSSFTLLKH